MLLKCCTQYVSKFGKLSSGHRTGKGQFSFQSQKKECQRMFKLPHKLCLFHMPVRLCSKSFKLGFSSMWTENFQIHKLSFKEAGEPEIKLRAFFGSWREQGNSRNTSTSPSPTTLQLLTVCITTNCGKFWDRSTRPPYLSPEKSVCGSRSNS